MEKLELTKHSANKDNAAGFFIKALKGDWISTKALQVAKAKESAKQRKEMVNKVKVLSAKIEKLSIQKDATKTPIIAELIADDTILKTAYDTVFSEMSNFMKQHNADVLHLPIREQYEKSVGINSGVNMYLLQNYADKFKQITEINAEIEQTQKEIKRIKNKYPASFL